MSFDAEPTPMQERRAREVLRSFESLLGRPLFPELDPGDELTRAGQLWNWSHVVVAHGTEADPILNYANQAAIQMWETDLASLLQMPSRLTAEPVHRDERAAMLQRTRRDGYIDDYRGIRITATGRRFLIQQAIVWNVSSSDGEPAGQAATFDPEQCEWLES